MAGRPRIQKLNATIRDKGGDTWLFSQIADGIPIGKIAEAVGCSRPYLYMWRDQKRRKEERRAAWAEARRRAAGAMIEDGDALLERLSTSHPIPAEVTLGLGRARYKLEMAKIADPSLAAAPGPQVSISIGSLHLDTLRAKGSPASLPAVVVEDIPEAVWSEADSDD